MNNVFGYILRWIIALAFFLVIACTLIVGLIFYKPQQLFVLLKPLSRAMLKSIGVRIRVTGVEYIGRKRSYLIVINHESLLDPFICLGYIPMHFVVIELADHFSWPVWGKMITLWGNIPLNRTGFHSVNRSFEQAASVLKTGTSVVIFPEGVRTITGEMQEFKRGAFHLAFQAKADILPIAIDGLYRVKTRGDWRVRSANVSFNIGKPLRYEDYKNDRVEGLKNWAYDTIRQLKNITKAS